MPGLPEVTIAGTLTADPELRYTPTGAAVANFTLAANERRYDKTTGTWADGDTLFLRCTTWRQLAEHTAESLRKGYRVLATGTLRQRSFETEHGDKRTVIELTVTELGASLKWATVTVHNATRTGDPTATADDPWAHQRAPATAATAGPDSDPWAHDKPPF